MTASEISQSAPAPSTDAIISDLVTMIQAQTKDTKELGPNTTIQESGIDSFDFIELVYELEGKYGIDLQFNANTAENLKTVADVAALIQSRIAAKQTAP
ncbi:MAG: acyl carrier protein [Alphaproteobacteria bacterium]|nr:acyl carrier protein [Alphaproteobacteria bacterium]